MTLLNALGWTLFHLLWEGSVVALALAVTLCFARSSRLRYACGCAALAMMPAVFAITLTHLAGREQIAGAAARALLLPSPALNSSDAGMNFGGADSVHPAAWAAFLWLAGVAVFYIRAAGGWISIRGWRSTGVFAPGEIWVTRCAELSSRLGVTRRVVLLQSSLAEVPVVMGCLRPVILIPMGLLTGMPQRQIEYILMHELAHICRHDYVVNLLQTLAEGLLFYHPAVWWISGVIREERENCCDDIVAGYGDTHEYAATLAALEEYRHAVGEPALAATGGNLMKRIRRLLKQPEGPRAALTPVFSASLVILSVGVALAYQAQSASPMRVPSPKTITLPKLPAPQKPAPLQVLAQANSQGNAPGRVGAPADAASPWSNWLTQDVAYIIEDQERAAYRALNTDEEREHFVEQFWLRRDPTPGTPVNEFREEHYRRIAFTNQHFGENALSGWKTDRGRIYIVYGPPDEIDSHPSGGKLVRPPEQGGGETTVYPFEQWRYRYIQGVGENVIIEFVDVAMTGEYHMTMDPHQKDVRIVK
jgi:GWxTD domain-containing protein